MEQIQNTDTLTRLQFGDREYLLVGTAHVSQESVLEVEKHIAELHPSRVCVELDEGRYKSLTQESTWQNVDIFKILKEKKAFLLLGNLVLSASQRRMGLDLGIKPGAEMKAAVEAATSSGIPVSLIDREIQTTLRRAWGLSGFWGKNKLLASLLAGAFSNEKITPEELEKMKQKSSLQTMLEEVAEYLPSAKRVLIDERDEYLAKKLHAAVQPGETRILAVVGAGHVPGMVQWLEKLHAPDPVAQGTEAIESVPPPSRVAKIIPWIISAIVIGLIAWGFVRGGAAEGFSNFGRWFLVNGTLSGLGAILALGHPVTILAAILGAPFTSLNPTIGVGFVTGLVETAMRKPRVVDFENLQQDILSFKGFYRNRVTRILLVFFFSTLGSALGTFIGIPLLFPG